MTSHTDKQRAYAAKRAAHTGRQTVPMRTFRIIERKGAERIERFADMGKAGAAYPDAIRIEDVEQNGGFY